MKGGKIMPRKKRETHLWFTQGDEWIEVESYDKKLNSMIEKLAADIADAVSVYSYEDGSLRCSVRRRNLTFRTIRPPSDAGKKAQTENGKRHADNLRNNKSGRG
jgi:hypothetical protein